MSKSGNKGGCPEVGNMVNQARMCNRDIHENFKDSELWLMRSDFMSAFAYWAVAQSPRDDPDISDALSAFGDYVNKFIPDTATPTLFMYDDLRNLITEDIFVAIPAIEILNHSKVDDAPGFVMVSRFSKPDPDRDFIDLAALARNVFYMIVREAQQ